MGDDLMDDNVMDLDLNQEPLDLPGGAFSGFRSLINELESAHGRIYERIRQLEAVTARARQRQGWRQARREARNSVDGSDVLVEPMNIGDGGGGHSGIGNVGEIERSGERGKGCNRESMHLVAKALEMDLEVKKVDKEGGSFYDCNICLEMAREPVLTCCGHLYCWVCFYKLPYVDSTAKECPVCKGEVIDTNVIPIYGNGDSTRVSEPESVLRVPPRPKARRVESIRQQRIVRGQSHIPVAEALRRISTSIGPIGNHLREMPRDENFTHDATSQHSQILRTTDNFRLQSHQFSRVLSESAASLSTISSALDNAERLVEDLETYIGHRLSQRRRLQLISTDDHNPLTRDAAVGQSEHQILIPTAIASSSRTHDVPDAVVQLENLAGIAPGTNPPELRSSLLSRRRSAPRLSDVDRENLRQARRRRLL